MLVRELVVSLSDWHERISTVEKAGIKQIIDHEVVNRAKLKSIKSLRASFNGCIMGKIIEIIFQESKYRTFAILDLSQYEFVRAPKILSMGTSQ